MVLGAEVQDMSVDQLAGAIVLVLGAIGSLLLVIWQSRCACRCRIGISDKCYLFDCERKPPPDGEKKKEDKKGDKKGDKDKDKDKEKDKDKDKDIESQSPKEELVPTKSKELEYVSDPIP